MMNVVGQDTASRRGGNVSSTDQPNAFPANTYALIIGISDYAFIKPLKYADQDAGLFMRFLMSPSGGNVPRSNILFIANDSAKCGDITIRAYGWVTARELKKGDRFYIYFAGHGDAMNDKMQFFMAHDANPKDKNLMNCGAVRVSDFKYAFIEPLIQKGAEVIFIVDACRSNELKGGPDGQKFFRNSIIQEKTGELMLIATGPNQVAFEHKDYGKGHGLFTYYLIEGLIGKADEDGDKDGVVSYTDLKDYVPKQVRLETSRKDPNNPDIKKFPSVQVPEFCCDGLTTSIFSKVDKEELAKLKNKEEMRTILGSSLTDLASNRSSTNEKPDSLIGVYYRSFNKALKDHKLSGPNSAEDFYNKMAKRSATDPQTIEAKYTLAGEYINFGQGKINIYLSGKDINTVNQLGSLLSKDKNSGMLLSEEAEKMERIILVKYKEAADLMEKAINLLKKDEFITRSLYPKLWFLRVKSYLGYEDDNIKYDSALKLSRRALASDTNAAYNYHTMGLMLTYSYPDSGLYYYHRSIEKAPSWSYPYNEIGAVYYDRKQYDSAILYYRKALAVDSSFSYPYINLGLVYYNQKDYKKAEQMYNKALEKDSSSGTPYNNLALIYEKRGDTTKAVQLYRKAISKDPIFSNAYHNLGTVLDKQNKKKEAEEVFLTGIQKSPEYATLYNDLGILYFTDRKYPQAEKYFLLATQKDAYTVYPFFNLGLLYDETGKTEKAEEWFLKTIKLDPDYYTAYYNLAFIAERKKDTTLAIEYYTLTIEHAPEYAPAYNELGFLYYSRGNYTEAEKYFKQAIQKDPKTVYPYYNLGLIYSFRGDSINTEYYYKKAIAVEPTYVKAYYNLGNLYYKRFNDNLAEFYFKRTVELDKTFIKAYNDLGLISYTKRDYKSAEEYYRKCLLVDSNYVYAFHNLGILYMDTKKYDLSEKNFRKAISKDGDFVKSYYYLAQVFETQKDSVNAEKYYLATIQKSPGYASAHNDLGRLYYTQKKLDQAEKYFRKATELDSSLASAFHNLGLIYHDKGSLQLAERYYLRAISKSSTLGNPHYELGTIYESQKFFDKAAYHYEQSIEKNYSVMAALAGACAIYLGEKLDMAKADRVISRYISLYPDNERGYYYRSMYLAENGDFNKSIEFLETSCKKGLTNFRLFEIMGSYPEIRALPKYNELLKKYFPGKEVK